MHYPPPRLVALRTTPPENPHIWEEPRFQGQDTRSITHWGIAQAEVGPIAAPGKYTLKITVDGQSQTKPFEILLPPGAHAGDAEVQSSVRLQLKVRDDITAVSDMTNQLEWMRKQIEDEKKTSAGKADLLRALDEIDRKMRDVEYKLVSEADVLSDDKYFITADRLFTEADLTGDAHTYPETIEKFNDLLDEHFKKSRSVQFYAEALNMHPNTLNALVKKYSGRSAKEVIIEKIMLEAKFHLTQSSLSVKEIAHLLGFDDPNYFSYFFKRSGNISPADLIRSTGRKPAVAAN